MGFNSGFKGLTDKAINFEIEETVFLEYIYIYIYIYIYKIFLILWQTAYHSKLPSSVISPKFTQNAFPIIKSGPVSVRASFKLGVFT